MDESQRLIIITLPSSVAMELVGAGLAEPYFRDERGGLEVLPTLIVSFASGAATTVATMMATGLAKTIHDALRHRLGPPQDNTITIEGRSGARSFRASATWDPADDGAHVSQLLSQACQLIDGETASTTPSASATDSPADGS